MSNNTSLPAGWVEVSLGEIRAPGAGSFDPAREASTKFELYSVPASASGAPEIIDGVSIGSAKQRVEHGTVLLCKINPRLNRTWIVGDFSPHAKIASTEWIPFRRNELVEPRYLACYLRQEWIRQHLIQHASGIGGSLTRVRPNIVDDIPLWLPPWREQQRIADKLDELSSDVHAAIAALERGHANLKRYRAAVLKAAVEGKLTAEWRKANPPSEPADKLLQRILIDRRKKWEEAQLAKYAAQGKPPPKDWKERYVEPEVSNQELAFELPKSWCWTTVAQTAKVQGGIQKQPKRAPGNNAFPYLRVANVLRNKLDLRQIEYFELFEGELSRFRLEYGDMLVVEGNGSKSEIGRSAIWRSEIENCVHQNHLIRVRFEAGIPEYLNAYWNSPLGNRNVMEKAASTSGLYTLSTQKVSELPLPLPSIDEQRQIVKEVEALLSTIARAEVEICSGMVRAARLRQAILKRAFEGKLVPQDPNDEPASVLLERIRAARASGQTSGKRSRTRKGDGEQRQRSAESAIPPQRGKKKSPKRDLVAKVSEGFEALKRERDV